jgi:hypothetical protein
MRTTITIDDEVAARLKELQHRSRSTFKDTVNAVLLRGLLAGGAPSSDPEFRVEPFAGGFASGLDSTKLNQLLDEWEADDYLAKSTP